MDNNEASNSSYHESVPYYQARMTAYETITKSFADNEDSDLFCHDSMFNDHNHTEKYKTITNTIANSEASNPSYHNSVSYFQDQFTKYETITNSFAEDEGSFSRSQDSLIERPLLAASTSNNNIPPTDIHPMSTTNANNSNIPSSNLTAFCGIVTPEIERPIARPTNPANRFECPRCGTRYTRAKTVQDAFPGCVQRYGNPLGLRWSDHPRCANTKVEPPRGRRLQIKKTRREKIAAKKAKNAAGQQITLGNTPVPESIEAQFKVESIESDEMPIRRFLPAFVNPQDLDLYRNTESIARELYATPSPAFDFPGLEPEPFASVYPDFY